VFEVLRFILKVCAFDITVIITNTLGGIIGLMIFGAIEKVFSDSFKSQNLINMVAALGTVVMISLLLLLKMNMLPVRYQKYFLRYYTMIFRNILPILIFILPTHLSGQDTADIIASIDKDLIEKKKTISEVLTDMNLMYLHSLAAFREVVKKNANTQPITIAASDEPGVHIVINGIVTNRSGKPLNRLLIYFYHTSDKGWYSDTGVHILEPEGDHRHARLFGYVKTDSQGMFTIHTIRPNGYPKSDLAAHIHIQMWKDDGTLLLGVTGELQFADDARMTEARRKKSIDEGYLIADNTGSKSRPVYRYVITAKME
jgi:protocatechuate 3,4-dioxygenase beta subunit